MILEYSRQDGYGDVEPERQAKSYVEQRRL
jgi:hypothetical protein